MGRIAHDGDLTTRSGLYGRGLLLLAGGLLWMGALLYLPMAGLGALAFATRTEYGGVEWSFTWENLQRLLGYDPLLGFSWNHLLILWRSLWLAALTTAICLFIGFPMACWIAARSPRQRVLLLAIVMVPSCVNLVIRTYAWQQLLGGQMLPAWLFQELGLVAPGMALYPSPIAVYIGMVSCMLPFTVLPLYTSVERLDWHLVEAARDLHAGRLRTFRHGILSQCMPGLVAATVLTLIPSLGMFVVPDMLGGAKFMLVGNLMQQQFGAMSDWPFGAAAGLFLILASLVALAVLRLVGERAQGAPR
jgi:spermidine/putrescine transport system permease protein